MDNDYWEDKSIISTTTKEKEEHLKYEIDMFRETCRRFIDFDWNLLSQFEKNLLVESLSVHTRILVDFFYSDKIDKNDIVAQDLLPKGKNWSTMRPPLTQALRDAKQKANKQLAHLSAWRIKIEKDARKGWNISEILKDIEETVRKFGEIKNLTNNKTPKI